MACGILVPWPGMELMSCAVEGFFTTRPPGKTQHISFRCTAWLPSEFLHPSWVPSIFTVQLQLYVLSQLSGDCRGGKRTPHADGAPSQSHIRSSLCSFIHFFTQHSFYSSVHRDIKGDEYLALPLKSPASWAPILRMCWKGKISRTGEMGSFKVIRAKDGEWTNRVMGQWWRLLG